MRIAIGQLWQESNTFNPVPTTLADFEAFGIHEGAEILQRFAETNELGGFIQSLRAWPEAPEIPRRRRRSYATRGQNAAFQVRPGMSRNPWKQRMCQFTKQSQFPAFRITKRSQCSGTTPRSQSAADRQPAG